MGAMITVGQGRQNPHGKVVELDASKPAAEALRDALQRIPPGKEAWFSGHVWHDSKRSADNWLQAQFIGVDVDYYDSAGKHAPLDEEQLAEVMRAVNSGMIPGSVFYDTPRGFRVVFALKRPVTASQEFLEAAGAIGEMMKRALHSVSLEGFVVDEKVLLDRARLLYSPTAIVDDKPRSGTIVLMREEPYALEELGPPRLEPTRVPAPAPSIAEAVAAYNHEHARDYPRQNGTCPACGHKECFGRLPDEPSRWACFSASHEGCGVKGSSCFTGDALDLDAYAQGLKPVELLRRAGYLSGKAAPAAGSEEKDDAPPILYTGSFRSACLILERAELRESVLGPGELAFDDFRSLPSFAGKPIDDETVARFRYGCEQIIGANGKNLRFSKDNAYEALVFVAKQRRFNPVKTYLRAEAWDGVPRIERLADEVLHVEASTLTQAILRKWLISAVARVEEPGCQVDTVLILAGPQGIGKSSFFRVLGDEWFVDTPIDPGNKDAYQNLNESWIYEWAELSALQRARDQETAKAFISARVDTFRAPYDRAPKSWPRHCVIVGSTNEKQFLSDATGNRRYWILHVEERFNLHKLGMWRQQLWAEALAAYAQGEKWVLPVDLAQLANRVAGDAVMVHPWLPAVESFVEGRSQVTIHDVLLNGIKLPLQQLKKKDEQEVGAILRALGWESQRRRMGHGERRVVWLAPGQSGLNLAMTFKSTPVSEVIS